MKLKLWVFGLIAIGCKNPTILETKTKELYNWKNTTKDYGLKVLYMPSNATIQSAIQVRSVMKSKEEILATYERYNFMDTCYFANDTTFLLVIRDTISVLGHKPDTMNIFLPNKKAAH